MVLIKIDEDKNNKRVNYLLKYKNKYVLFYTLKVNPIIITPECIEKGLKEDCNSCNISCLSPRSFCIKPYKNHKKGCPNYGLKEGCPPNVPMFDKVYDINKPIYLGINEYNLIEHERKMKEKHPEWTKEALRNSRHYQPIMEAINFRAVKEWIKDYPDLVVTNYIESMGIDLVKTLKNHNIELLFGDKMDITRRIILMGSLLETAKDNIELKENVKILKFKNK